jgi:hypothetical protein
MIEDEELEKIGFCRECGEKINLKRDFHRSLYENLFLYKIRNKQNEYLLYEEIDASLFIELYNEEILIDWVTSHIGQKICGECLVVLRPYIKYINDDMYIFLPSKFEMVDGNSSESEEEYNNDIVDEDTNGLTG